MLRFEMLGGEALAAVLRSWSPQVQQAAHAAIGRSVLRLQSHIRRNKLSGQVLGVRTGTLRRSIDQAVVTASSNRVTGEVGTNLKYGIAHEYGFNGSVNVKAHLRQIKQAFGRPLKQPVFVPVRAYSRHVSLPERSFLRSALKDLQPAIEADLRGAIERAIT